jgi:RimJ/RimL family protein N-acetyltransferase
VLKPFQGSGLANKAMQALLEWIKNHTSCDAIHLTVFSENHRAYKFWQKQGFQHVGNSLYRVGDVLDTDFLCLLRL